MDKEVLVWLEDIKISIDEIEEFLPEKKDFFEFQRDLKTKKAVERNIEIIGEAVSRILKVDSDIHITNARKIIDTRNRIIHGYDSISDDIIWTIVSRDLYKLKKEILVLIGGK